MTGLPKIVRDRLGRAPGGAAGVDHPDANLLAGFVEHSLTSRERSLVLGHLAQCAECREQVSVALPKLEAEMAAGVARGWLRWPVLRWGLLVASLVIMGTVALLRQPSARRPELASRASPSTAPLPSDVTVGAAPGKAARPPAQETALPKGKSENDEALKGALDEAARKQAVVAQALPPPAAPVPAVPPEGQPAQQALGSLTSPQPQQVETSRASEEDKRMSAGETVGGPVQAPPPPAASRQLASNFVATSKPRQAVLGRSASAPAASPTASGSVVSSLPTAEWSISASGKVQCSQDGGKTWEELDVDKNVVFRVVFAVGADVWLGGSKGALYHSTDGGQHWTRIGITTGSTTVTDDVTHIDFKDAQHGAVRAAAGDTWTTLDAGQHWQKQ